MSKNQPPDTGKKILTEKADGKHKPDAGPVHGNVKDGSCDECGADAIGQKNIKK